ncbi:nuclear transport factor 2 family protein [Halieaceae bacterium IMCC8485]|jgi:predicted ester cyclase|uniref:Nuclear transport factor 2 family protein n=1 Tax=Candidatus Seongchinamella marina TaxID=2518990 RepID=A0ABT3SSY1_9GAMM|nr:nuclear transport factor 2 family protein [Candidatus Seongchinamella marina]MCX2972979.1 nuclear transport factor 2 family protein [Candidatus Seongchinamella marina]
MADYQQNKSLVLEYFDALEGCSADSVGAVLGRFASDDCEFLGSYPFNEMRGHAAITAGFWQPLFNAFQSLQRRQDIFIAGSSEIDGDQWVMSMGHFMGLFDDDWLGIRATRKMVMLRYAEFNCIADGKIVRTGMFLDIVGLMQQVGCNPLPPQTGASFVCPGPRNHDGIVLEQQTEEEGIKTLNVLNAMIADLEELNKTGDDNCSQQYLARTWDENMLWYGPAGIGASYTIPRYQEQHQYPFREGLTGKTYNGHVCRFAEGNFACFFGWPNLSHKPTGGLMGLPGGEQTHMRVVDVYRREGDKLIENWVIIDIPYWLKQQGLDVLERTSKILNP